MEENVKTMNVENEETLAQAALNSENQVSPASTEAGTEPDAATQEATQEATQAALQQTEWEEKQEALRHILEGLERDEVLAYIIGMGKQSGKMNWLYRTVPNKIQGCISQTYFCCEVDEKGNIHLEAESEALSIQGAIGALSFMLEGEPARDLRGKEITVFHRSGFMNCLLPQRQAAVEQMLRRVEKAVMRDVF